METVFAVGGVLFLLCCFLLLILALARIVFPHWFR
jgi:hypothetical protein